MTKITTVSKLDFPLKRDMNEIGPRDDLDFLDNVFESYKSREKKSDLWLRIAFVSILGALCLWAALTAYPAEAKTIELRECRTNAECCELYLAGNHGHVVEDAITKSCAGV